jgi:hypothetical protein
MTPLRRARVRLQSENRCFRRSGASRTQTRLLVDNSEVALVNFSTGGLRVELMRLLTAGERVQVSGEIEGSEVGTRVDGRCHVRWCAEVNHGMHHAGLSFENAADVPAGAAGMMLGNSVDYYEMLKLSRGADSNTIRRAYHTLGQRYHPDNLETGSQELFDQVVQANKVLSDPARRAAFDIQLTSHDQNRLYLFEQWQSSREVQSEFRKRRAILRFLYDKRFAVANQRGIVLRDFENLMECPREHLEFSFWVLRESKLVTCGDGARYEITFRGVAAVEAVSIAQPVGGHAALVSSFLKSAGSAVN